MRHSSKNYDDAIAAQWRSWANSEVVYTEDFAAALLTGTELPDNSLAKGATRFEWIFDITNPHAAKFITRDNASGIENQRSLLRFCKIGSKESSSAYNQYGQGRICALTSFMPIYEAAEWTATFKHCGNPKSLSQISHPWRSSDEMQSSMTEIPIDETNRDLGFEWDITFDTSIFGEELASDPRKLFAKTKERLTTKYTQTVFDKTEFVLTVKNATQTITESSRTNKWKTLRQMFEELPASCVKTIYDETFMWKSIQVRVTEYLLMTFPKTKEPAALVALRTAFPTFGTKCENSQRVHISNDGRLIESRPKPEMEGRKLDNHQNGEVVFIDTDSTCAGGDFNDQPTPCTIKVSIKKDCENLKGIYKMYRDEKKRRAEEERAEKAAKAAKEKAERAAKAAMEKAAKEAATREAIAKAAREASAKKLAKPPRRMEVAAATATAGGEGAAGGGVGGGGGAQQAQAQQSSQQSEEDDQPTSPSMPKLYSIPTFATFPAPAPSPATPAPPALPKSNFTAEDMKELLKMSLTLMSSENAAILKTQVKEKYGFETS
jgi:hypothetical protein